MSEDEDCDDLPMISVNTSVGDSSTFAMPSAEEVASQRARELECEEELLRLRERDLADQRRHADAALAALAHSDSSGSEGDAQLAAAVTALNVQAPGAPPPGAAPPGAAPPGAAPPGAAPPGAPPPGAEAAALWAALAPRLPPPARTLLQHLRGPADLDFIVASVAATLASEAGEWADEEVHCACALLCAAMLAHESRSRRAATRAMHALLDDHATAAQESDLAILLLASFPSHHTRLQLSDALRSGGQAGADRLAATLTCASMLQLLQPGPPPAAADDWRELVRHAALPDVARAAAAWRRAPPAVAYACVQLAGRALAAGGAALAAGGAALAAGGAALAAGGDEPAADGDGSAASGAAPRAELLTHLAPPASAGLKLTPDRLKLRKHEEETDL